MPEAPSYDDFLADPVAQWRSAKDAISHEWAIQAARGSLAFREELQQEVEHAIASGAGFDCAPEACAVLGAVFDAQDIAQFFSRLTRARPPAEWAGEFGQRFARG